MDVRRSIGRLGLRPVRQVCESDEHDDQWSVTGDADKHDFWEGAKSEEYL